MSFPSPRLERVKKILEAAGEPAYRLKQFSDALFRSPAVSYADIKGWSDGLRSQFSEPLLEVRIGEIRETRQAKKFLLETTDGQRVESVHLSFRNRLSSLCVSTQVGCLGRCRFCATGQIGFRRHLTADEILDTVLLVRKSGLLVDRITLMGMGEAFLNPHIWEALLLLCHRDHLGLSPQRISLSTVGVVPGIQRLTKEFPSVTLTFSFHFPFQSERDRWMPLGKTYPLEDVFKSLDNHAAKTGKKIYLAYIVFEGLNDDERHAHQLKDWITQRPYPHLFHLNLLPYHTTAGISLPPSTPKGVRAFYNRLRQMGLAVTVRQSFGHEIQAACGQLAAGYGVG